jgi:hypothetical protein
MSDEPAAPEAPAAPVKKPGFIRKSAVIVLLGLALLVLVVAPFVANAMAMSQIKGLLAGRGLELTPESRLSVSVFGGAITGTNLGIRRIGSTTVDCAATNLNADLAMLDSLDAFDLIIDDLAIEGMTGSLRRHEAQPPKPAPEGAASGTSGGGVLDQPDWLKMAKRLEEWYLNRQEQKNPQPGAPPPARPAAVNPPSWTTALRYQPAPKPGGHWPRVLVRKLSVNGSQLGLPDMTVFDVTSFSVKGTNVALDLLPGETMTLSGHGETTGSGPMDVNLERKGGENGSLTLKAEKLPVEALSSPAISGDTLTPYGAKGVAKLDLTLAWTGWELAGTVESVLTGLSLTPDKEAGDRARQVAAAVNALKGKPIRWPVKLGGTLYAPTITDTGVETVLKEGAFDAAKGAAMDNATEEADKLLEKQGEKNPEVKKAADAAKGLLKGLGK